MNTATEVFYDQQTGINRRHPEGLPPDVIPGCPLYAVGQPGDDRIYSKAPRGKKPTGIVATIGRERRWSALLSGETRPPWYTYCIDDAGGKRVHLTVGEARLLVSRGESLAAAFASATRSPLSIGDRVARPPEAELPLFDDAPAQLPPFNPTHGEEAPMKPYWVLWNPESPMPPRVRFDQYDKAVRAAEAMAARHPGQYFHVLEGRGSVVAAGVCWTSVNDEPLPF